jgi:hypothetical protein
MKFIPWSDLPKGRTVSYYNEQVKVKTTPSGELDRRVRGTYGGNITDYKGPRTSWAADLQTVKCLLNATVSEDAYVMSIDIRNFYLAAPLERKEFMRIHRNQLTPAIISQFGSQMNWRGDYVLVQIDQGLYGLPHAGLISATGLNELLEANGYKQSMTPCLYVHEESGVAFALATDDFLVKFKKKEDAEHLITTLEKKYDVKVDWQATKFLGMTIVHDRVARTITLSMPGYVEAALKRFNVVASSKPTISPAKYDPPNYGKPDLSIAIDSSPPLAATGKLFIQEVVGTFLFYGRAVDNTMLTPLSKIATRQSTPTQDLMDITQHFLQYAATHPNAQTVFHASDMVLLIDSDASYLSENNARSRAGGFHRCVSSSLLDSSTNSNGAIDSISCVIPSVVSSAAEAELAATFINAQSAVSLRTTLAALGYPQGTTKIICDNTTATGIANGTVKIRRSKAMDMRWHWIQDRTKQGQFKVEWRPGTDNKADFFTKTHPASHFRDQRQNYVTDAQDGWTKVTKRRVTRNNITTVL